MNMDKLSSLDNNQDVVQYIKDFIYNSCDSFSDILQIVATTLHVFLVISNTEE